MEYVEVDPWIKRMMFSMHICGARLNVKAKKATPIYVTIGNELGRIRIRYY